MKGVYFYLIIILLALSYIVLTVNLIQLDKKATLLTEINSKFKKEIALNTTYEVFSSKNSIANVLNDKILLVNSTFESINVDSLLARTNLILRIPEDVCNPCFDSIYPLVFEKNQNEYNVIVIMSLEMLKDYKKYFDDLGIKEYVYGLDTRFTISKELDSQSFPYIFKKDEKGIYHNLFVINKDSEIRIKEYLNLVSL